MVSSRAYGGAESMPVTDTSTHVGCPPPEWRYEAANWQEFGDAASGWSSPLVASAYVRRWPSYRELVSRASAPLSVRHETRTDRSSAGQDLDAHNTLVAFAFVLALASRCKTQLSV